VPMDYAVCRCESQTGPHVHLPQTDDQGVAVGAVWDKPQPPESRDAELERRLHACEVHLQDLEERLNARGTSDR
jgi:hypothetical protein